MEENKQVENQKNDKKPPKLNSVFDEDKKQRKGPKFNIYWIYAIIGLALLSANFLKMTPELYEVVEKDFKEKMLYTGDVDRVILYPLVSEVKVFIKKDSIYKPYYQKLGRDIRIQYDSTKAKSGPLFKFNIADPKTFQSNINAETEKRGLPKIPITKT